MKNTLKWIILSLSLIIFLAPSLSAADFESFKAENYTYIEDLKSKDSSITDKLNRTLSRTRAFVYVSGCHLDGEALPAFQALTAEFSGTEFIRLHQNASTDDYMLKNYGSHGAPQLFFIQKGRLVSAMPYYYTKKAGRNQFAGWPASVKKWAYALKPVLDRLDRSANITPVSSFNYKPFLRKKTAVLLRTDISSPEFAGDMNALFDAAAKFPHIAFALDTGIVAYNQEFTTKYRTAYSSFSIIKDSDSVESVHRKSSRGSYDRTKLYAWINSRFGGESSRETGDMGRKGPWMEKIINSADSYQIASMDPDEFKRISAEYNVIGKMPVQQTFYVLINAVTDGRRNSETAKLIIKELRYETKGGIGAAVNVRTLREKVYVPVIERAMSYESNRSIRDMLKELADYYRR